MKPYSHSNARFEALQPQSSEVHKRIRHSVARMRNHKPRPQALRGTLTLGGGVLFRHKLANLFVFLFLALLGVCRDRPSF